MTSIENSELDFSELDSMSELELNIFFNQMVDFVRDFRKLLEDEEFLKSLDKPTIIDLYNYYDKIFDIFLDWELVDNQEDIAAVHAILGNLLEE
jgi:hypothetical protein